MDSFSDIEGLFSKLPYDASQYQEIGKFQDISQAGLRWALVAEITRYIAQSGTARSPVETGGIEGANVRKKSGS